MESPNKSVTYLPLVSCHLIDLPDNREDCSIYNESECIRCHILGRSVTGEGINDYFGVGHIVCLTLLSITCVIGTFGTFTNCLIIAILQGKNRKRAFDTLLIALACFDLICSLVAVIAAFSAATYFQNWNRGAVTLYCYYIGILTALFAKSGSSFMTVLITIERFLVVTLPTRAPSWFTASRCKLYCIGVLVFAFLMAFPRFSSVYVGRNYVGKNMNTTMNLEYIILSSPLDEFWYVTMDGFFDQIDFWLPLPLLLLFNALVYFQIKKFSRRRKELKMKHRKDIRAAKMFVPVVIVLFLCNIEPIIHYYHIYSGIIYREHFFGILVSMAINSAANLPIYYFRGSSFRKECRALLSPCFPCLAENVNKVDKSSRKKTSKSRMSRTTSASRSYHDSDEMY
ncbi:FMRFamide receptor [Orchesella cincta]|uniref:FMRFamide receptor n=1 Tax=Orchesella cincta TaxID=48709 RepID=A0A1D2N4J7_ORCCI|nr:FMRFamide receptor [Orchesella cincta]